MFGGNPAAVTSTPPPTTRLSPGDPQRPGQDAESVSSAIPPRCASRTRLYRGGQLQEEGFAPALIADRLGGDPDSFVWLDLYDPDEQDLQIVTEEFGLHPLAVEDAVHEHQRPKLDRYRTHCFLTVYAAALDGPSGELSLSEISAFLTSRALITIRKNAFDIDALLPRWDANLQLADSGVGFLLHGLLDAVVDGHLAVAEQLQNAAELAEDQLFETRPQLDVRRRGFQLRKTVVQLRRVAHPMTELISDLRREPELVTDELNPYYQDVHDHAMRAVGWVDRLRDLLVNILDTSLNEQSYELNEVTKKLAAWAAIIAVPTAVTGFYGQNVPYPGFSQHWGFIVSAVVMVGLAGGLYLLLRHRKWL
ncbi:MAG: magnesium transporter [Frankiaceae bacterium]|nr:magnesium transporter [Frankiaceae bacterium]